MPHFAEINTQTNEVLRVIVAKSKLWCEYELGGTWFRTYYDTEGKNFAPPQAYPSWTLDDQCIWQPPVTRPEGSYNWNEETQSWDESDTLP
jgi:hypothetical protein